jgi:mannose-6-phosphate isomerase-like protein (cupin superfamily)
MSNAKLIEVESLRSAPGDTPLFQGQDHGGVRLSIFVVNVAAGEGPKLHVHPYDEVFVVHEGEATFTVGDESVATRGGQIVVARREVPHRFENSGSGRLRLTAIHPNEHTIGRWVNGG